MEAAVPAPIPFPWKRALPGLVVCVLSLMVMCVAALTRSGPQAPHNASGPSIWTVIWSGVWNRLSDLGELLRVANAGALGWILLALLLTFASILLSLRLMARRV